MNKPARPVGMSPELELAMEMVRLGTLASLAVARRDGRISLVRREPDPRPRPWLKCLKPWGGKP